MFYKQFSKIIDILNPEFVKKFDYWLTMLPSNGQKNITTTAVSSQLEVSYSQAEAILNFAEKQGILEKYYLVKCPDCYYNLDTITKTDIAEVLTNLSYCDECNEEKIIKLDDIYTAYKVILQPDVSEAEIAKAIEERLNKDEEKFVNFTIADSLAQDKLTLYEAFYNPSESAYEKFSKMREDLDKDYGKNTTAKGKALEKLILEIFNHIRYVNCTNDVKTKTNQFDCTALCSIQTSFLSVYKTLTPYFIIECKNEKDKPVDNTYCNKLLSIMETNAAQLGIIFGRKDATEPCFIIAREHYLTTKNSAKQMIIITCFDRDLDYLIDKKVNLLKYLEFKIFQVTANSPNSKFDLFLESQNE